MLNLIYKIMVNNNTNFAKLYTFLAIKCVYAHNNGLPVVVCGSYYMYYNTKIAMVSICSCKENKHVVDVDPNDQSDDVFWKMCTLASFFGKPSEILSEKKNK